MWGLGRPLTFAEMGRVLRLGGVRPDQSIRDYERGKTAVSGPLSLALEAMLSGWRPADLALTLPGSAEKAAEPAPKPKATSAVPKVRKGAVEPQEAPRGVGAVLQLGPTPRAPGFGLKKR